MEGIGLKSVKFLTKGNKLMYGDREALIFHNFIIYLKWFHLTGLVCLETPCL